MSDPADLADDPEFTEFAQSVRAHLLPALSDSALTCCLIPLGDVDIKFAVELGLSIMLDKPIIAIVAPGQDVPERLRRVADRILVVDLTKPGAQDQLQAAIRDFMPDDDA